MTGMETIVKTRLAGKKPGAVFVYLVDKPGRVAGYLGGDQFRVEVGLQDRDPDLRPLVGCYAVLFDTTGNRDAYARLAKAAAKANPSRLHMVVETDSGVSVHQLENGVTKTAQASESEARTLMEACHG